MSIADAGWTWPLAWGTGLFLAFLFAANTTIGSLLPGLKKPMDFVEHYENQASALLASPIVLVEAHRLVTGAFGPGAVPAESAALPVFEMVPNQVKRHWSSAVRPAGSQAREIPLALFWIEKVP